MTPFSPPSVQETPQLLEIGCWGCRRVEGGTRGPRAPLKQLVACVRPWAVEDQLDLPSPVSSPCLHPTPVLALAWPACPP